MPLENWRLGSSHFGTHHFRQLLGTQTEERKDMNPEQSVPGRILKWMKAVGKVVERKMGAFSLPLATA